MTLSDSRFIVRMNDRFSGPLTAIPHPHRNVIANSVVRGQRVENQDDAAVAIAYAQWQARRFKWFAIALVVLGLVQIVLDAIVRNWVQLGVGVITLGVAMLFGWFVMRLRRSISLNEGIAP
jgi:TM2 domain-containing membrane protein YozV